VPRPLTSGPGGGQLARFYVGLAHGFLHTCLREKGKAKTVEKVGGGRTTWPAGQHLVSYRLNQVSNPSLDPYKYPFYLWKSEHTPHFGDSTCKAPILSVLARHSVRP
jgi:hypothetical protein